LPANQNQDFVTNHTLLRIAKTGNPTKIRMTPYGLI
jgi:hypothetical protein